MQCLPKQLLLIYLIYRRPEGNSIPIYESMGQKSPVSDSSRSLRVLWEVLACSGGKMFLGRACKASPFHDQRLQGQDGAAKLIQTEV